MFKILSNPYDLRFIKRKIYKLPDWLEKILTPFLSLFPRKSVNCCPKIPKPKLQHKYSYPKSLLVPLSRFPG